MLRHLAWLWLWPAKDVTISCLLQGGARQDLHGPSLSSLQLPQQQNKQGGQAVNQDISSLRLSTELYPLSADGVKHGPPPPGAKAHVILQKPHISRPPNPSVAAMDARPPWSNSGVGKDAFPPSTRPVLALPAAQKRGGIAMLLTKQLQGVAPAQFPDQPAERPVEPRPTSSKLKVSEAAPGNLMRQQLGLSDGQQSGEAVASGRSGTVSHAKENQASLLGTHSVPKVAQGSSAAVVGPKKPQVKLQLQQRQPPAADKRASDKASHVQKPGEEPQAVIAVPAGPRATTEAVGRDTSMLTSGKKSGASKAEAGSPRIAASGVRSATSSQQLHAPVEKAERRPSARVRLPEAVVQKVAVAPLISVPKQQKSDLPKRATQPRAGECEEQPRRAATLPAGRMAVRPPASRAGRGGGARQEVLRDGHPLPSLLQLPAAELAALPRDQLRKQAHNELLGISTTLVQQAVEAVALEGQLERTSERMAVQQVRSQEIWRLASSAGRVEPLEPMEHGSTSASLENQSKQRSMLQVRGSILVGCEL